MGVSDEMIRIFFLSDSFNVFNSAIDEPTIFVVIVIRVDTKIRRLICSDNI